MRKQIDMCNGPLFSKIIMFTLPIMLTGVLQLLFNAADLVVVGQFCSSASVAAVGATGSLTTLFVNLFIGISTGCAVTTAHAIGAKDSEATHLAVHTAIPTAAICGSLISVIGILASRPLLIMMDTPADILPKSALYMKIYFAGMIFNMLYNFGASILRAAGDTKSPLIFLTIAGLVNVGLNVVFVTLFHMDVAGVALATTASQALSAVLVIDALLKRTDDCRLVLSKLKIHTRTLSKILRIGIPSGIQSSLFSISNVIIQSSINSFGTAVVSGSAAASSIEGFGYITMNAFYQTTLNFVGQNDGAKKYDRIKKIFFICLASVIVTGIIVCGGIFLFGRQLLGIYITDSPAAIEAGMIKLMYICLPYFLCGLMEAATGAVRGLGCSLIPMITTVLSVCGVRILWTYTIFQIPEFHTLACLFVSYPISWALAFTCQALIFAVVYKKRKNSQYVRIQNAKTVRS